MVVSEGSFPDEISWEVIIGGLVEAEGGAGETVGGLCVVADGDPTSTPTITVLPTMTSWPTQYGVPPYIPLSAFYTGTQRVTPLQGDAIPYPLTQPESAHHVAIPPLHPLTHHAPHPTHPSDQWRIMG